MSWFFLSDDGEILVRIPRDTGGGSRAERADRAVRFLWSRGIYPGPAAMGLRLYGHPVRSLSGLETSVRNGVMVELRIPRQRRYDEDPARDPGIAQPAPRVLPRSWEPEG